MVCQVVNDLTRVGSAVQSGVPFTGERVVPNMGAGILEQAVLAYHQAIYSWIAPMAAGRKVLDIGCGTGHGTAILDGAGASWLCGTDIAADAVAVASRHYESLIGRLAVADALRLPMRDAVFDLVCAVEVVEHVASAHSLLAEIQRILQSSGSLVLSTPNRLTHSPGSARPMNPFHVVEYDRSELMAVLMAHFTSVTIFSIVIRSRNFQLRYLSTTTRQRPFPVGNIERFLYWRVPPWSRMTARRDQVHIQPNSDPRAYGLLAVCTGPRVA